MNRLFSAALATAIFTGCVRSAPSVPDTTTPMERAAVEDAALPSSAVPASEHAAMPNDAVAATTPPPATGQAISQEEMMAKMVEAGTPGPDHAALAPLIGSWHTEVKMWNPGESQPTITQGTADHEWLYGKRFIKETFRGTYGGRPFEGMGLLGYDNTKKRYVSTWVDSMNTSVSLTEGSYHKGQNELEMQGAKTCPTTGQEMVNRNVVRIIDRNHHLFEMYVREPNGADFKVLEIAYKRKA